MPQIMDPINMGGVGKMNNPSGVNVPGGIFTPPGGAGGMPRGHSIYALGTAPNLAQTAGSSSMPTVPFTANGSGSGLPALQQGTQQYAGGPNGYYQGIASTLDPGMLGELTGTYGEGMGDSIYNFLAGGAGYNSQVAQALIAQMQPGEERQQENLLEQFGAGGNRFSSAGAIGLGDLESQQSNDENATMANLYQQSVQNYLNTIMGTKGDVAQNQSSGIGGFLSDALQIGGDIGGMFVGDPGLGSQLGGLASLFGGGPSVSNIPYAPRDTSGLPGSPDSSGFGA